MVRTQIYLNEDQKSTLDRLSVEKKTTVSNLIRDAIEEYLTRVSPDFQGALERSFGIWKNRKLKETSSGYVRDLRAEWEKREKRN